MVTVRRVGIECLPILMNMGRELWSESTIAFPKPIEAEWRAMIERLGSGYFMAIAEADDPVGFITAQTVRYMFSATPHVAQDAFYVRPTSRGSRAALLLVRALEGWAKGLGVEQVILSIHSGVTTQQTGQFFTKLGYAHMGGNYCKGAA